MIYTPLGRRRRTGSGSDLVNGAEALPLPAPYRSRRVVQHPKMKIPAAFSARRDLESLALLFSGYPIGEPRRNNRYRDNNAYYNDVENKPADAQLRFTAINRGIERALETT